MVIHYPKQFPGVATGWNMGLMRHRAPWYLVINDDIAFQKGLLQRIAELVTRRAKRVTSSHPSHPQQGLGPPRDGRFL